MRAIETGRSVIQVSTVGVSAMYSPDGSVIDMLPTFTAGSMVKTVPLSNMTTPATVLGGSVDWAVGAFAVAIMFFSALLARRRRGTTPHV